MLKFTESIEETERLEFNTVRRDHYRGERHVHGRQDFASFAAWSSAAPKIRC